MLKCLRMMWKDGKVTWVQTHIHTHTHLFYVVCYNVLWHTWRLSLKCISKEIDFFKQQQKLIFTNYGCTIKWDNGENFYLAFETHSLFGSLSDWRLIKPIVTESITWPRDIWPIGSSMGGVTRPANVSVASRKKKPILEAITLRTSVE